MSDFYLLSSTIDSLKESGNIDKVVLIGSWCEHFYENIFSDYTSNIRTKDNDYLIDRRMLTEDKESGNLFLRAMRERGYEYTEDFHTSKTKLISIDRDEEIEFLIPLDRKNDRIEHIKDIGVNAEVLTHIDILKNNTMKVLYNDTELRIPTPEAYVLQKLIINDKRKEEKQEKDVSAVKRLLPEIQNDDGHYKELIRLYDNCSKKEKASINKVCAENGLIIKDREYRIVNGIECPIYIPEYENEMFPDEQEKYKKYLQKIDSNTVVPRDVEEIKEIIKECRNDFLELKNYAHSR